MSGSVSIVSLESDALTALRSFLLGILTSSVEVVRGQQNRVPEPTADDYVVMTPIGRARIDTTVVSYLDNGTAITPPTNPPTYTPGIRYNAQPTQLTVQLDVHGPHSADNTEIITTLFRSGYACDAMATASITIQPLYVSDPRQVPYIDSEDQFEDRWSIDAVMQVNPVVSTPQQFAHALAAGLISIDASYPPGAN